MLKHVFAAAIAATLSCAVTTAPAFAQAAAPAKQEAKTEKKKGKMSAALTAMRERQKKCGAEWKEAKAAGKTKGQTWPKYWSACNKRLKST